jgi:hypothetical protein
LAPGVNCLKQLAACGLPNAANTGVQPGVALDTVNGDVTLSTPGQVYQGHEVHGCITVSAANVTIRNVRVTGDCGYSIDTERGPAYDTGPTTIEHVEIACPAGKTAIGEKHLVVRFVNIHGCENGFDLDGFTTITDSWLHDLLQNPDAHTDGIQTTHGSSNIVVQHNVIDSRGDTTSAIITDPDNGTTNVTISGNILAGGSYTLYCRNNSTGWSVTNNRFVMGAYGYTDSCDAVPAWSGNVVDSTNGALGR